MSNIIDMFEHPALKGRRMIQTGEFFTERTAAKNLVHCVALDSTHNYVRALWLTPGHEERIIENWSWRKFRRVDSSEVKGALKGLECTFIYRDRRHTGPIFHEEKVGGIIQSIAARISSSEPTIVVRNLTDDDIVIIGRGMLSIGSR